MLALFGAVIFFGVIALAIVAPLIGFSFFTNREIAAVALWKSHGRLTLSDGVRVISAARARTLALLVALAGIGGLILSCAPTAFVFGSVAAAVVLGIVGTATLVVTQSARRAVLRDAHPVDVLPPE
jgi:hypothetical protein